MKLTSKPQFINIFEWYIRSINPMPKHTHTPTKCTKSHSQIEKTKSVVHPMIYRCNWTNNSECMQTKMLLSGSFKSSMDIRIRIVYMVYIDKLITWHFDLCNKSPHHRKYLHLFPHWLLLLPGMVFNDLISCHLNDSIFWGFVDKIARDLLSDEFKMKRDG